MNSTCSPSVSSVGLSPDLAPAPAPARRSRGPYSAFTLPLRAVLTAAEATEIFHNRPPRPGERVRVLGAGRRDSAHWPRNYARLRGDPLIFELARGIRARERASVDLGPRWEVEHLSPGAQLHGALSHPEFARALRAA